MFPRIRWDRLGKLLYHLHLRRPMRGQVGSSLHKPITTQSVIESESPGVSTGTLFAAVAVCLTGAM